MLEDAAESTASQVGWPMDRWQYVQTKDHDESTIQVRGGVSDRSGTSLDAMHGGRLS